MPGQQTSYLDSASCGFWDRFNHEHLLTVHSFVLLDCSASHPHLSAPRNVTEKLNVVRPPNATPETFLPADFLLASANGRHWWETGSEGISDFFLLLISDSVSGSSIGYSNISDKGSGGGAGSWVISRQLNPDFSSLRGQHGGLRTTFLLLPDQAGVSY